MYGKWVLLSFTAWVLAGCGSQTALVRKNLDDTKVLRDFVKTTKIMSGDIHTADSLYLRAEKSFNDGDIDKARWQTEYAKTFYQMGMLHRYLKGSEESLKKVSVDFEKDKEHLASLLEVYEEIKTLRKQ